MKKQELFFLVKSDLYRNTGEVNIKIFMKNLFFNKGFKISFIYRLCHYFYLKNNKLLLSFFNILFHHYKDLYSIDLSYETNIDSGLYIGHVFGIAISPRAKVGKNINLSQSVTIGFASRGKNKGYPTIGDNVYIGPGAVVIGNIKVGNNVAIGANCVVTKDIPDNAVVVGVPAKIISYNGSTDYVIRTDYE